MSNFKIYLKSFLYLILCLLASFVIVMFFPTCYNVYGDLMCVLFGICSLGAAMCIYGDFCWKLGKKMHTHLDTPEEEQSKQHFGFKVGLVPTVINYIYVVILYLSKFGVIKYDFYPTYKTLNYYFVPWTYLVAPNVFTAGEKVSQSVAATDLSWGAMTMLTLLPLTFLVVCWGFFYIGYNNIDVISRIVYKKSK